MLALYFDKGGKVSRIANYGMKDGKVFDFVSRTTPTGGQEPSFLQKHHDQPVPLYVTCAAKGVDGGAEVSAIR